MKMRETQAWRPERGAVSMTAIIVTLLAAAVVFVAVRFFLGTAKEATTAVSDRNKQVIESRKVLVKEQTERIKTMREAEEAP
jgi:flagellar basal body-associated protein FliL